MKPQLRSPVASRHAILSLPKSTIRLDQGLEGRRERKSRACYFWAKLRDKLIIISSAADQPAARSPPRRGGGVRGTCGVTTCNIHSRGPFLRILCSYVHMRKKPIRQIIHAPELALRSLDPPEKEMGGRSGEKYGSKYFRVFLSGQTASFYSAPNRGGK